MNKNVELFDRVLINTITMSNEVLMIIPKRDFNNNNLCCKIALENRERISRIKDRRKPANRCGETNYNDKVLQTYNSSVWSEQINDQYLSKR